MKKPIFRAQLRVEQDVVTARQRARLIAERLGLGGQDQVRLATTVSEIARNAFRYAGGGQLEFRFLREQDANLLEIEVRDRGRGIPNLAEVLDGRYVSTTGMGIGLIGARRLMDRFHVESSPAGTTVTFAKAVPRPGGRSIDELVSQINIELFTATAQTPLDEVQQQNHELLDTLAELQRQQQEIVELNRELEETNRGVVALYAELDDKAHDLERASDMKTRFLSNMSHEFRTPLNSINSLARMLLAKTDGPLTLEQEKQVKYISKAAQDLGEMVNDLLDIAKVEAGKVDVAVTTFSIAELFGTLRGMLRPLVPAGGPVALIFDEPGELPPIRTDEQKLSQILRNFVSNAVKYTERGEVRVTATLDAAGHLHIAVRDTGIGIKADHLELIFEEFYQVENPLQQRAKGTGLGLPLSRKLAELLGGRVTVESTPGAGSVFTVILPTEAGKTVAPPEPREAEPLVAAHAAIRALIVDDEETSRYILRRTLTAMGVSVAEATNGHDGLQAAQEHSPHVIFLDIGMPDMNGFEVLASLKKNPATRAVPVIIHSARTLTSGERGVLNRDAAALIPKDHISPDRSHALIAEALTKAGIFIPQDSSL